MPDAEFPDKLACLFEPARYKVLYGGRGGAKSWGVARALLILGASKRLRVLCAREIQKSMKDSVHKLLSDQIGALGLAGQYQVFNDEIRGRNGTEIVFAGLRHNVDSIKSKEGIDIVWVEEAQIVSKASWDKLIPTIRKDGSEIWVTFNPELESDDTYQRFVAKPPPGAVVVKIDWRDNPWFPAVLDAERRALMEKNHDDYLTVWEGHCKQTLDGAIYAAEIREATAAGRITRVPYDPSKPVNTAWDLGRSDMTAIWFVQTVGFEHRVIDYYENCGHALGHYLRELQSRPYVYGEDWLPHDAAAKLMAAEKSIEQQARDLGRNVRVIPQASVVVGINAARTLFPRLWFDAEKCADGLTALRHYQFKVDPGTGQRSKEPLHNWASHGADALRMMAMAITEPQGERERRRSSRGSGWMGA
jgi:phage terminase large subunit